MIPVERMDGWIGEGQNVSSHCRDSKKEEELIGILGWPEEECAKNTYLFIKLNGDGGGKD